MSTAVPIVQVFTAAQQREWENAYASLPKEVNDVHLTYEYHCLFNSPGHSDIRLFYYTEGELVYYYPFLIYPVSHEILPGDWKDIETVYGYTGPVSNTTEEQFLMRAIAEYRRYVAEEKVVSEFIRFHPILKNHVSCEKDGITQLVHLRDYVVVDLEKDADQRWLAYNSANRNKIRKAQKAGVKILFDKTGKYFPEFREIYLENMKSLQAAPLYYFNDQFFERLDKLVRKAGVLLVAEYLGNIIGAAVFLGGGMTSHYYLASAKQEGKTLAAGNLLLHEGIQWAAEQGMSYMHLGGGLSGDPSDALLIFKKNFSPRTEKFYIGKRIHQQEKYELACRNWENKNPENADKYKAILQRYRLTS